MAQYVAERNDTAVKAVGFIASIPSPYLEFQVRSSDAEKRRLEDTLKHARELVAEGKGQEPVGYANWFPAGVSIMGSAKMMISFFVGRAIRARPAQSITGRKSKFPPW